MKPRLLALDFDGVVCDGVDEMAETAWRALSEVVPPVAPLTPELGARFVALRPAIESGWEMVALMGVVTESAADTDGDLHDGARWAEARDAYIRRHALERTASRMPCEALNASRRAGRRPD